MSRWMRTAFSLAALLALPALAGGCAGYQPKAYTADDRCRDCGGSNGLFTGEDGVFTIRL